MGGRHAYKEGSRVLRDSSEEPDEVCAVAGGWLVPGIACHAASSAPVSQEERKPLEGCQSVLHDVDGEGTYRIAQTNKNARLSRKWRWSWFGQICEGALEQASGMEPVCQSLRPTIFASIYTMLEAPRQNMRLEFQVW